MASNFQYSLLLLLLFISPSSSSFSPKALVLPVTKDTSTNQYISQIHSRTPLVPLDFVLDLGGQHLWVDWDHYTSSSTCRPAHCKSTACSLAGAGADDCSECFAPLSPTCINDTCTVFADNHYHDNVWFGYVVQDIVSVQSTNGFNPGQTVTVPNFILTSTDSHLLEDLAKGVSGMAGLGRNKVALPSQFASAFNFPKKFAMCLSSSSKGVVFFGDGPYVLRPDVDVSKFLTYTPLIVNPVSTSTFPKDGEPSAEYFIGVKSIKIDQNVVPNIKESLLSINKKGRGGTKLSTVYPYTALERSIFMAVAEAFIGARNYTRVASVAPFDVCFDSRNVGTTRLGPAVPSIDLVLESGVSWMISGVNAVVEVKKNVMCLAVVNGGKKPMTSIVIGGFQLENNLVQIDLESNRLGFSDLLLWRRTTCANFNFNSATM